MLIKNYNFGKNLENSKKYDLYERHKKLTLNLKKKVVQMVEVGPQTKLCIYYYFKLDNKNH